MSEPINTPDRNNGPELVKGEWFKTHHCRDCEVQVYDFDLFHSTGDCPHCGHFTKTSRSLGQMETFVIWNQNVYVRHMFLGLIPWLSFKEQITSDHRPE